MKRRRYYELIAFYPDGSRRTFSGWGCNVIAAQNRIAHAFPEQFPTDWRTTVRWTAKMR